VYTNYDTDIKLALKLLLEAANLDKERILSDPKPSALLNKFGDKALEFNLNVSFRDIDLSYSGMSDLLINIENIFKENGIKMFRPTLEVSLEKVPEFKDISTEKA
jgi:small-conductance mechanosensitive channel